MRSIEEGDIITVVMAPNVYCKGQVTHTDSSGWIEILMDGGDVAQVDTDDMLMVVWHEDEEDADE